MLIALLACDASDPMDSSDSAPVEAGIRWVVVDYVCGDGTTYTFTNEAPFDMWLMLHSARGDGNTETWIRREQTIAVGHEWSEATDGACDLYDTTDGRLVIGYL